MSVRKKGNKWYYRFMINGIEIERAAKGATDLKTAKLCEIKAKNAFLEGNLDYINNSKRTTMSEAIKIYENYANTNKLSHETDQSFIKRFTDFFGSNTPIDSIRPAQIEEFKEAIRTKTVKRKFKEKDPVTKKQITVTKEVKVQLKNATINRHIEALRKLFNLCIDNKLLKENPCKGVSKLREDNYKIRYLSKDEKERLFANIKNQYLKDIVSVALYTGMRKSEILNIKWDDIDGKYLNVLNTKNGKKRIIMINSKLKEIFDRTEKSSEYVFTNPNTKTKYIDIGKQFETALKKAKIKNFTFHCLRHTAATKMLEKGIDIVTVQEILDHADIKTTMRYAHTLEDVKRKAFEVLEDF